MIMTLVADYLPDIVLACQDRKNREIQKMALLTVEQLTKHGESFPTVFLLLAHSVQKRIMISWSD